MCGIAGLFLKQSSLEPQLGSMLSRMLTVLSDRGPDSAGFAVYGRGTDDLVKLTLRLPLGSEASDAIIATADQFGLKTPSFHANHVVVAVPAAKLQAVQSFIRRSPSLGGVEIVGSGTRMEIYKDVGLPGDVARRFDLAQMSGTHAIGHTRMATESAVTTKGAHPFSTGVDQCLVHNGSLSNHNGVRRGLQREGLSFETDNDSEVAARYFAHRLGEGASLPEALEAGLRDLDGFFTFTMGTRDGFAVLRDGIACKPAVLAETDDWVAMASEFRSLANLPGVEKATIWEPKPAVVYTWSLQ